MKDFWEETQNIYKKRKVFGFSGLLLKTKNFIFDRKQSIECLPETWKILVYI